VTSTPISLRACKPCRINAIDLDRQIERVEYGGYEVLGPSQVAERVADILDQASAIPGDFARASRDLEDLNRSLRRQLLDSDYSRGDVLDEIFDGVDLIGESDAERSFNGFYRVLLDKERAAWIRPADRQRPHLSAGRGPPDTRNYVTSEEFAEDRRMVELLRSARTAAADAVSGGGQDVRTYRKMEAPLVRIGMPGTSVSTLSLRNPGDETVENAPAPSPRRP
jgi:hypothetical protein